MCLITKITEQKRANRRNVFLDGRFAFGCNLNVIAKFRLREGMHLTAQQLAAIKDGEIRQECFDRAMHHLQRRLHSRSELSKKLARDGYDRAITNDILDDLTRLRYLDDARFARTKALSSAEHKKHGRRRALVELRKSGVNRDVAERALDEVYDSHDTLAVARELAQKDGPRLRKLDPPIARRRLAGMLQRRGFDYDDIRPIIEQVLGQESDAA